MLEHNCDVPPHWRNAWHNVASNSQALRRRLRAAHMLCMFTTNDVVKSEDTATIFKTNIYGNFHHIANVSPSDLGGTSVVWLAGKAPSLSQPLFEAQMP